MEYISCNLCSSDNTKLICTESGLNIVECDNCGLIYVNPRFDKQELEEFYRNREYFSGVEKSPDYKNSIINCIKNRIKTLKKFKDNGKLLDIGCASGYFLEEAAKENFEVYGTEISEYSVNLARGKGLNVFWGTLKDIGFPDDYFDIIVMIDVLEHTLDPLSELIEIRRILNKDGIFFCRTPNVKYSNGIASRIRFGKKTFFTPRVHLYHFSKKTLRKMLEKAGFKLLRWEVDVPRLEGSKTKDFLKMSAFHIINLIHHLTGGKVTISVTLSAYCKKA